jgi:predicted transcriptional regulator
VSYYSKFENILPYELIHSEITEELGRARNEINKIIDEDLRCLEHQRSQIS